MDPCVIRSRTIGGETTITNTFNDDTFGLFSTKEDACKAKTELSNACEVKDLGDPTFILGLAIYQDPLTKSILLSQKAYLMRLLDHFKMSNCNPHLPPYHQEQYSQAICHPKTRQTTHLCKISHTNSFLVPSCGPKWRCTWTCLL